MSTLADPRHRASDPQVKTESRFGETPRRRWWQRPAQTDPAAERSTFPHPDADTRILPQVPHRTPTPAALPPVLYRERPADLDKAAYNIALTANSAGLNRWSALKLEEQLAKHLRVLHALAEQERAEGLKLLARNGNGALAAAQIVEDLSGIVSAEQKANELPGVTVKAHVATDALGSELVAVTANQGALGDETAQFQRITPGMPDPRVQVSVTTVAVSKPVSPVHVPGDDLRPAVPAAGDPVEDTGTHQPLPKRVPQASTQMVLPATDLDPYEAVDPTANGKTLASGAWVFDEGTGTGGPVWFLLGEQCNELREGVRVAVLKFANGHVREVRAGTQVRVLDVRRAQVLVAQIEARLAQRDAEAQATDGAA